MTYTTIDYTEKLKYHRRSLHRIPEINRHLPKTKDYLLSVLTKLDCTLTFLCDSGICAFFDRGSDETYAFRADMDGLPVTENLKSDYASAHDGAMHACGHDGHMSMVLTFGEYVNTRKDLNHNVLLIFQPAEEMMGGADEICKSGILKKHNVTRVFGIHLWPFLPAGIISSKAGAFMPKSAEINIYINGKSAHGTAPYEGLDALYIATDYVQKVYRTHSTMAGAVPRFTSGVGELSYDMDVDPEEKTLIHFGKIESGYARNIVSDKAHLLGTIRAYNEENFQRVVDILRGCLKDISLEYGCETKYMNSDGYPPVFNDPMLYEKIKPSLMKLSCGYEEMELPLMISEDFSFYGLHAPALFFVLGTGTNIPLHSKDFDFDEKILLSGFELYCRLIN